MTLRSNSIDRALVVLLIVLLCGSAGGDGHETLVLSPLVTTAPLFNYEDAPATPDADDPAVWWNRGNPRGSLVIGTAKDAGLLVYDLSGQLLQALLPPNAPHVTADDPDTPAGTNPEADLPCPDSDSQETFGRFNNVDIVYGIRLGSSQQAPRADVAVVSDRGCDRVRFYKIDPDAADGPLVNITAATVPRVFPIRYEQPSPLQPSGAVEGWRDNPVDDQNTVYGLTIAQDGTNDVFVSQRERGLVHQLEIVSQSDGTLSYELKRTFLFHTSFALEDGQGPPYNWTPCREAALEEPQSEGLAFDAKNQTLYVAFETIGLFEVFLAASTPVFVDVFGEQLIEPVTSFGRAYRAIPDDEEFECEYDPEGDPEPGDARGSSVNAGQFLAADLEGLGIIESRPGQLRLLASSQGDSSFHVYDISQHLATHRGVFFVDGVEDTDGVHYVPASFARPYPHGLLVIQNGAAPEPPDTGDVNGYEFDGATQFMYLNVDDVKDLLRR